MTGVGLLVGVRFATGPVGVLAFLALAALWGLAFAGFPYAVAYLLEAMRALSAAAGTWPCSSGASSPSPPSPPSSP